MDFETFLEFARANSIGYGIYALLLFPLILILILLKKHLTSVILSTILLISQLDLFDHFIDYILQDKEGFLDIGATSIGYPFLLISGLFIWLMYKSVTTKSLVWHTVFIAIVVMTYLWLNDRNCTTEFIGDIGKTKNDLGLWFSNCGTFYAWWTASILTNITILREIRYKHTAGNNGYKALLLINYFFKDKSNAL